MVSGCTLAGLPGSRRAASTRRLGPLVEIKAQPYPVLQGSFRSDRVLAYVHKAPVGAAPHPYRADTGARNGLVVSLRIDAAHQPIPPDADAHLAVDHEGRTAEHPAFGDAGEPAQRRPHSINQRRCSPSFRHHSCAAASTTQAPARSNTGAVQTPGTARRAMMAPARWSEPFATWIAPSANAAQRIPGSPANANGVSTARTTTAALSPSSQGQKVNVGGNGKRPKRCRIRRARGLYQARKSWAASSATCSARASTAATHAVPKGAATPPAVTPDHPWGAQRPHP